MTEADDVRPVRTGRVRAHLRRPTWRGWFAIALVLAAVAILTAWAIDYRTLHGQVARNVTVEDVPVGRLDTTSLHQALAEANDAYGTGDVEFVIAGKAHQLRAADIGLQLDEPATLAAARRIERSDPLWLRPITWAASFLAPRRAPVRVRLDHQKLATALADLPGQVAVREPRVAGSPATIGVTAGKSGFGFEPDVVARQIESVARDGTLPIRVTLVARPIDPKVSDASVRALAARARKLTRTTLELKAPGKSMTATAPVLRSWMTSTVAPGSSVPKLAVDNARATHDVVEQIGRVVRPPKPATFTVKGSQVVLIPDVDGSRCCSAKVGDVVLAALEDHAGSTTLPMATVHADFRVKDARKLGITTLLGARLGDQPQVTASPGATAAPGTTAAPTAPPSADGSTTSTTQPRVGGPGQFVVPLPSGSGVAANVQRAVPLLRGRILLPGKTLSLNEVLGAPSPDNGYSPAAMATADGPTWISGGGTDLVAAALFEAAYYGGLDIPASERHNIKVPGTTPGIEATLGWTQPDLVIRNPSKHGVLVWVDLTASGVRVQLFSTPFASVATSQKVLPFGPGGRCTAISTTRTRSFTSGGSSSDTFAARYTPPPGARDDPNRVICPG